MQERRPLALRACGSREGRRWRVGRLPGAGIRADERGVAALELALTLPLFAALLLGAADLAVTAARARQVEALVDSAGKAVVRVTGEILPPLRVGFQPGGSAAIGLNGGWNVGSGLPPLPRLSLRSLVDLPDDVSASLRLFRGCPGDQGIREVAGPRCPDGSLPAAFAEIAMTAPVDRLVDWPSALLSPSVSARSLVRLD